ncbi:hypothetical protein COT63_01755 [Candidatus Shapirobacteria bacterium CG09_land_8_20_14_0_10_38_17]|uniref:Uncharacterized protein n=1 Tax=Candidatus Shapirobacteria bacterium CG09_land_8_20_14_0_10_38_17 TaxID=1974884 RepID=A0A2H0WR56_9BACT|nr:MAG: hypothetical protein COT63_01755 [Candidatus Shapirobacteria bacterium CG09_land_8_20_14_0_10_38_17]
MGLTAMIKSNFKIFVNFKTYPQGRGMEAVRLARICQKLGEEKKMTIIPVVQAVDIYRVRKETEVSPWVQHIDWQESGQHTGWINLEAVVEAGAVGTLLNHSEHRIPPGKIRQILKRVAVVAVAGNRFARQEGRTFQVMVCCRTLGQLERLVKLKPDFLAYEPPELIGGTVSVSREKPRAVEKAVRICRRYDMPLIVGAGIHSGKDVLLAKKMGAMGVLVSSAVVLSEDPEEKIKEMLTLLHC